MDTDLESPAMRTDAPLSQTVKIPSELTKRDDGSSGSTANSSHLREIEDESKLKTDTSIENSRDESLNTRSSEAFNLFQSATTLLNFIQSAESILLLNRSSLIAVHDLIHEQIENPRTFAAKLRVIADELETLSG